MITRQALESHLKALLQPELFSDGCPNGLQVEGKANIGKIATAVTANLATIEAAVDANVDALIVHHGLFWNRDSYVVSGSKRKKLELLLNNEISLFAYHLPLDAHKEYGNNWRAARELGWRDLEPFGYYNGTFIGVKGVFDPIDRQQFTKKLEEYYSHPAMVALGGDEIVKNGAIISGGAYKSILEAADANIGCFITGNYDLPAWDYAFEEKVNFFALGHSNTEKIGPRSLGAHIYQQFSLPCHFIDIPNPF